MGVLGILNLQSQIPIPGIEDSFKSGDFYPWGLGIFENLEIFSPGYILFFLAESRVSGIFLSPGRQQQPKRTSLKSACCSKVDVNDYLQI